MKNHSTHDSRTEYLIQFLKRKKIDTENINTSGKAWRIIFNSRNPLKWYQELTASGYIPTREELAEWNTKNFTNAWHSFAKNYAAVSASKNEFQQGALSPKALHALGRENEGIFISNDLLRKGVRPKPEDLAIRNTVDGANAWGWLAASKSGLLFIKTLLKHGVRPKTEYLSHDVMDGVDGWALLSEDPDLLSQLYDLDIIPMRKLQINGNHHREIIEKINKRVEQLHKISRELSIEPSSEIALLLSRDDIDDFDGYLIFYLDNTSNTLPQDMFHEIGKHLLPSHINLSKLFSDEDNKLALIKHCALRLLDSYNRKLFNDPRKGTSSLRKAVSNCSNLNSLCKLLWPKFYRFKDPGYNPNQTPSEKCQQPVITSTNGDFFNLLKLALTKHCVLRLFDSYNRKFFNNYGERADSLLHAILNCNDINALYKLIATQYYMFETPGYNPYQNPSETYQQPVKNNTNGDFFYLLRNLKECLEASNKDLCQLDKTLKQEALAALKKDPKLSVAAEKVGLFGTKKYPKENHPNIVTHQERNHESALSFIRTL